MKNRLTAIVVLLLTGVASSAQNPVRVYTEPAVPPQESLDKLNLQLAWRVYLPTDRRRDGIFSVQVIDQPGQQGQEVLVQTRSGVIILLDAETGVTRWRARLGNPYTVSQLLGYNSPRDPEGHGSIFAVNGLELYALDRITGVIQWQFTLPHGPTSAPVADRDRVYVTMTGRVQAFQLPPEVPPSPGGVEQKLEALSSREPAPAPEATPGPPGARTVLGAREQGIQSVSAVSSKGKAARSIGPLAGLGAMEQAPIGALQPLFQWEYLTDSRLELSPIYTLNPPFVLVASYNGAVYAMTKDEGKHLYRLQAGPPVTAPLAQTGTTAIVASEDFSVYALDVPNGYVLWRFGAGGPVLRRPVATDRFVYVVADRTGLYQLDLKTGDMLWRNTQAARFLASNNKYVYATDANGRLLILDAARGNTLTSYEGVRDFVVPITNSLTDRIFLASNDGLLICMRDREYAKPQHLAVVEEAPAPVPAKGPAKGTEAAPAPAKQPPAPKERTTDEPPPKKEPPPPKQ
jgi:outer membrane protein assembly factor BamB